MLQQLAVLFNLSGVLHFHHLIDSRDNNICSFGFSKSALPSFTLTQAVERTLQENICTVIKYLTCPSH